MSTEANDAGIALHEYLRTRSDVRASGRGSDVVIWGCGSPADSHCIDATKLVKIARTAPGPDEVVVGREYLEVLEAPFREIGHVTIGVAGLENGGLAVVVPTKTDTARPVVARQLNDALCAYLAAHPPTPTKTPEDEALELLERVRYVGSMKVKAMDQLVDDAERILARYDAAKQEKN